MIEKWINKIQTIMKDSRESRRGLSLERLLFGLSKVYGKGVQFRHSLYTAGILRPKKLPCFVISIGNISVGGTGKTPMTVYLSKFLTHLGYKVVVITRGYKGKLEHTGGIVSNGEKIFFSAREAGDEPYMMAQMLGLPVVAGKKRYHSGMRAIERFSPDIIVLDDAYQHMALERDLNLLLLDAKKPLGNRYLLPRGTLREPALAIARSDAIILTRWDQTLDTAFDAKDIGLQRIPVFKSRHTPYISKLSSKIESVFPATHPENLRPLKGKHAFLFSGIANNSEFKISCEKIGLIIDHQMKFPDHNWYNPKEIDTITKAFKQSDADFIVTTQKDFIKISENFPLDLPLVVMNVQIQLNEKKGFEKFIKNKVDEHFMEKRNSWC